MTEEWRPVVGFEGRYEISSIGRVASLPTRTWPTRRMLALTVRKRDGYVVAVLRLDNRQFNRKVHQLVCESFHGARPDWATLARHLDGDRSNNTPGNVAWGTHSQNNLDAVAHGTHHSSRKTHCKHGHALSGENLYINTTSGSRQCRTCAARNRNAYVIRKSVSA